MEPVTQKTQFTSTVIGCESFAQALEQATKFEDADSIEIVRTYATDEDGEYLTTEEGELVNAWDVTVWESTEVEA